MTLSRPFSLFVLLLVLSASLFSQTPSCTTVVGNISLPVYNDLVSGTATIQAAVSPSVPIPGSSAPLLNVVPAKTEIIFSATSSPNFSVCLYPTDNAVPSSQYYTVTFTVPVQTTTAGHNVPTKTTWVETWQVPTSNTQVDLSAVRRVKPPAGSISIPFGQLSFSGLSNGCVSNLNGVGSIFPCGLLTTGMTWTQQKAFTWTQM